MLHVPFLTAAVDRARPEVLSPQRPLGARCQKERLNRLDHADWTLPPISASSRARDTLANTRLCARLEQLINTHSRTKCGRARCAPSRDSACLRFHRSPPPHVLRAAQSFGGHLGVLPLFQGQAAGVESAGPADAPDAQPQGGLAERHSERHQPRRGQVGFAHQRLPPGAAGRFYSWHGSAAGIPEYLQEKRRFASVQSGPQRVRARAHRRPGALHSDAGAGVERDGGGGEARVGAVQRAPEGLRRPPADQQVYRGGGRAAANRLAEERVQESAHGVQRPSH
eukprot:ctg_526.g295